MRSLLPSSPAASMRLAPLLAGVFVLGCDVPPAETPPMPTAEASNTASDPPPPVVKSTAEVRKCAPGDPLCGADGTPVELAPPKPCERQCKAGWVLDARGCCQKATSATGVLPPGCAPNDPICQSKANKAAK